MPPPYVTNDCLCRRYHSNQRDHQAYSMHLLRRSIRIYLLDIQKVSSSDEKEVPSVAVFKKKILSIIRPPANPVFGIHDPIGLSFLTQLRVGLSKLNFHKFKHNFRDAVNPMCPSNDGIEDAEHFLLLCPSFDAQRRDLLAGVYDVLRPFGHNNLPNKVLTQLLLYGDEKFSYDLNRTILNLTIQFIRETGRFE